MADVRTLIDAGVRFARAGRLVEAETSFRDAAAADPNSFDAVHNLAVVLKQQGNFTAARVTFDRALTLSPRSAHAHYNLGNLLDAEGKHAEAIDAFQAALALQPGYYDAHINLARALTSLERWEEAAENARRAIDIDAGPARGWENLAIALNFLDRLDEALPAIDKALARQPPSAVSYSCRGMIFEKLNRLDEAIASFRQSIALAPDRADLRNNLGLALQAHGDIEKAIRVFRAAIAVDPNYPHTHVNLSLALLLTGQYDEGSREYEWRHELPSAGVNALTQPYWTGAPFPGQTLFVWGEQGLGDVLHMARYLPRVKAMGGRLIVFCRKPVARLVAGIPSVDQVIVRETHRGELPPFDLQAPMMSLFALLGHDSMSEAVPYFRAATPPAVAAAGIRNVGLVWQGSRTNKNDRNRSIPRAQMIDALSGVPGMRLHSLQLGDESANMPNLTAGSADLADTAEALMRLDLVVSVDTAVAHLAGALGRQVWVLIPFAPDWRWQLGRSDTAWYPSMRLFRQPRVGDWDTPLGEIRAALLGS